MSYSAFSSAQILKWLLTTDAVTRPTGWTAHLYLGDPESGGLELADSAYAAQAVTFAVADADANSRSEATNTAAVAFPAIADAAVDITHVVIKDNVSNILSRIPLLPQRSLAVSNILSFPVGGLTIKGE